MAEGGSAAEDARLSEAVVSGCLEQLDWKGLHAHLASLTLDADMGRKLVGLVLRAGRLVFRYPGNLKRRSELLGGVVEQIRADLGDEAAERAATRFSVFELIDEGYASLRSMIDGLPLAGLSQAGQLSAYLSHAARQWDALRRDVEAAGRAGATVITGVMLETDDGHRYGADAATVLMVELLGMNVSLAAHRGKWFDADGLIRLPLLPEAEEEAVALAGAADVTAAAWQQWQLVEERCRYMDGGLARRPVAEGDGLPPGDDVIVHTPRGVEWELLDTIGNERLGERLWQTFQDMAARTNLLEKGLGLDPGAPRPPSGYVSPEEMHSAVLLSEFLGLDVATHPADLGGLRLCEWLRGFAVLQRLVNDRIGTSDDASSRAFPRLTVAELEEVLRRNGLTGTRALVFIDHASFARSSRDLYDAPILRMEDNSCMVVAPAMSAALLIRLVLSTLGNKGLVVDGKGEAFEEQFRSVLKAQGLPVYHFEARREGEVYEYDALVPWGRYLFVFECKNRALSGTNPIASYNLLRSTVGHAAQVRRLADALGAYPDILRGRVAEDCSALEIVPVVVNSMPFSMPGDLEGVRFADVAAINRFFSERYTHVSQLHRVGRHRFLHRVALQDLWQGESPDVDAFMRHLADPMQVRIMAAHMGVETISFPLGPGLHAVKDVPRRREMTMESIAAVAGLNAAAIEAEMERFRGELELLRARLGGASPEGSGVMG